MAGFGRAACLAVAKGGGSRYPALVCDCPVAALYNLRGDYLPVFKGQQPLCVGLFTSLVVAGRDWNFWSGARAGGIGYPAHPRALPLGPLIGILAFIQYTGSH